MYGMDDVWESQERQIIIYAHLSGDMEQMWQKHVSFPYF